MKKVSMGGLKIDLHIHSIYSNTKDKNKVQFNTIENLPVLIEKLKDNSVEMCAITDHDAFNYELYSALKETENQKNSIKKVFPGIEFSVMFEQNKEENMVHVIAIFDDKDDKKIANIHNCLCDKLGNIKYDRGEAFSEGCFLKILREIDLDTILIAHQKNSPSSRDKKKCDANIVGENKFKEFIYTDYFEAFEFRNKRNEIFNKAFVYNSGIQNDMRFITGSDCHDWRVYPQEGNGNKSDYQFTYVKCLPTFKGLVMAITDYRRIKLVNSFYNPSAKYLEYIDMDINGRHLKIPMSKGINVIIGDNSIGKSLLLHKLTQYKKCGKTIPKKLEISYDKYLKANNIKLASAIPAENIFAFDMQGEVREKFEENKIDVNVFLQKYFPASIEPKYYRTKVENELNRLYDYLEQKFKYDRKIDQLFQFTIIFDECDQKESITFLSNLSINNKESEKIIKLISKFDVLIENMKSVASDELLESSDKEEINKMIAQFIAIKNKYEKFRQKIESENIRINTIISYINQFKQNYSQSVTDTHKQLSSFAEASETAICNIAELLRIKSKLKTHEINLEEEKIEPSSNTVYEYTFISKLNIDEISKEYIEELIIKVTKKDVKFDYENISEEMLASYLLNFSKDATLSLNTFKEKINEHLDEDFKNRNVILCKGMDKSKELSAGLDAQIYFNLLSYENQNQGIYIVDQPEDNISQNAIKEYLLDRFKTMGEHRQVIIVTHNPQFIVNLDVDNVIYIGKEETEIFIQHGALEYEEEDYSILDIVAVHIEGGLDSIKRRWKRYEKGNSILHE